MSNDDRISLGAKLREAREYLNLSQDEVARVLGLTRPAISLIESGQRKVDVIELRRLADLYQKPIAYFTGEGDTSETQVPETIQHLARTASKLNEDDQEELLRFAEFLRMKVQPRRGPNQ